MNKIATVTGQISVRPCRVGMVCEPDTASVISAANLASGVWGGVYFPMLPADDDDAAQRIARALGIDVLYAVDDSPRSKAMATQPGFAIRDLGLGGPFAGGEWDQVRLLGIDWLIDHAAEIDLVWPTWTDDDPLSGLFSVWFGGLPDGEARGVPAPTSSAFLKRARRWPLDPKAQLPELIGVETLLGLTCHETRQEIDVEPAAFVVMKPQSAEDLRAFWNLRAAGQHVFPWPVGHAERIMTAARAWLDSALAGDRLGAGHSGAGERLGPHMRVIIPPGTAVPDALSALLGEKGVISSAGHGELPRTWPGTHPLVTDFRRTFSISFDARRPSLAIPFPSRMPSGARGTRAVGIVAAQVDFQREEGLDATLVFAAPNLRVLASTLTPRNTPELFQISALGGGRVVGVNAAQEEVELSPISVEAIFRSILESGSGWSCAQGDNGRFAAQLAERLGGAGGWLGNQPAIGAVLLKAASNPNGLPIPALIAAAKGKQGQWPAPLSTTREKYPTNVVYELLRRKLLLPVHKVKCPTCTVEYAVRPEDLAVDLTCEVCSEPFPLGFALGLAGPKTPWGFRLAGTVPPDRIREVMPVMAAFSTLSASHIRFSSSTVPHILGLEVNGPAVCCEIDIAMIIDDRGLPVLVIGEAKSGHHDTAGVIDDNDLNNLRSVQDYVREQGFECIVLAASGRDQLLESEIAALRRFCTDLPEPVFRRDFMLPVAPIVLTAGQLHAPPFTDGQPEKWLYGKPMSGLLDLAAESCRHNLGDFQAAYQPPASGAAGRWQLLWPETPAEPN